MVSVGVSLLGRTDLIFIDPDVKTNGSYYRDTLLRQQLLPAIRSVSMALQQDNAPGPTVPATQLQCTAFS